MTLNQTDIRLEEVNPSPKIVNDFCVTIGTVNGSGSQTANITLLRALFRMGIPVSGTNIFPSNIQGMPTWYTIRVNKDGFLARREQPDIVIAMNPVSFNRDVESLAKGGVLFYADDIRTPITRQDIVAYPMPVKKISRESDTPSNLREYIANMVYVGVVAHMLGIDMDVIYNALDFHFKGKQKAIDSNFTVVKAGAEWAAENLVKTDPYVVEKMNATEGYIMTDGNTAAALGAIYGGVQFVGWYPITPASTLAEALMEYLPQLRKDPETGKNTFAVIQAEDELAAVGMAIGAGWAGLRSMTSTSGPGFSLMSEYTGLAYFSEVPLVIWNVQRVGPATGLPTRTAQGDLTEAYFHSHGDTQHVLLLPGSVNECFEFGWKAFDLAERLQTPIMVLSDLDLGMNIWMTKKFEYPDRPVDRGKILTEEDMLRLNGEWGRYLDVDGDGIPYRTLPGNHHPKGAYFARGTGHDEYAHYSEEPDVWEENLTRIKKKFDTARKLVPEPIIDNDPGAEIGIIAFGSTDQAVQEARHLLRKAGIPTDSMRIRSLPFNSDVHDFIKRHRKNYVVEINRDGQLCDLLTMEFYNQGSLLDSVAHIDGLSLSANWISTQIQSREEK